MTNTATQPREQPLGKLDAHDLAKLREIILTVLYHDGIYDLKHCDVMAGRIQDAIVQTAAPQTVNAHDPDHWNPDKGGNRAADDYWRER